MIDEKALAAAILVGSNMAGERLVRDIVTAYLAAIDADGSAMPDCRVASNSDQTLPSEEEIAQVICREVNPVQFDDLPEAASYLERKTHFDRPILDKGEARDIARAILALFAPVLAENASLRETLRSNSVWDFPRDIQNLTVKLDASEARALAAEAALAGLRQNILDAAVQCDDDDKAQARLDRLAAAIRAQGE